MVGVGRQPVPEHLGVDASPSRPRGPAPWSANFDPMRVEIVPCLSDNYAYILHRPGSKDAVVVDASEAEPVERALQALGLELRAILSTHHHPDHVGGNEALLRKHRGVEVFGFKSDSGRIPGLSRPLEDDQLFEAAGFEFRPLHIPGHTMGAVATPHAADTATTSARERGTG